MQGHSMLILCDACGSPVPDQAAKEVVYQIDKIRYRLELCASCLAKELARHGSHRGIPGFRKRAAVAIGVSSLDELPERVAGTPVSL